ncbi:MAG: hypothetical protein K8S54_03350 [Spirochaetia bacterium]|nr:hypothetical protein [Spirochaetia bacterium]
MSGLIFLPPLIYLLSLLFVAYWLRDQDRGDGQYFLAGRNIGATPAILSVVANETSVATVMIFPAAGFASDFVLLWLCLGYIAGRGLVGWLFMQKLYDNHKLSIYETIGGSRAGSVPLATAYVLAKYIANGARFYMAGYALQQLFGWSIGGWIVLVAAIVAVYSLTGGIRAVVVTDQIQGSVIYVMGITLCGILIWSLFQNGSAHQAFVSLRLIDTTANLSNGNYWLTLFLGGMVLSIGTHGADQDMIQRLLATRDSSKASRSVFYSGIGATIVILTYLGIGVLLRETGHSELDVKSPLVDYIFRLKEPLLAGCFSVLLLSTGMSSLDSSTNSTGAIWKFIFNSKKPGIYWSVFSLICLVMSALLFSWLGRSDFLTLALGSMSYIHGALIAILVTYTFFPKLICPVGIILSILSGPLATIWSSSWQPVPAWTVQILFSTFMALLVCLATGWLNTKLRFSLK